MSWLPGGPQWKPNAKDEQSIRMLRYATGKGGVGPMPWEHAEREQAHASDSGLGLRRAAFIGAVAGLPAAFVLQLGMIRSLRMRQHALTPGVCPGVQYAVARDFFYLSGTQLQVQNRDMSASTRALALLLTVLAPIPLDTFAVRAVEGDFRPAAHLAAARHGAGGVLAIGRALIPAQALLGRLLWIPAYNAVYVQGQYALGEGVAGMVAGSLAASFACYPLFIVKTQLLLGMQQQQTQAHGAARGAGGVGSQLWRAVRVSCGAAAGAPFSSVLAGGVSGFVRHLWRGSLPHAIANLGPDCLCMGVARLLYAELAAANDT